MDVFDKDIVEPVKAVTVKAKEGHEKAKKKK